MHQFKLGGKASFWKGAIDMCFKQTQNFLSAQVELFRRGDQRAVLHGQQRRQSGIVAITL